MGCPGELGHPLSPVVHCSPSLTGCRWRIFGWWMMSRDLGDLERTPASAGTTNEIFTKLPHMRDTQIDVGWVEFAVDKWRQTATA